MRQLTLRLIRRAGHNRLRSWWLSTTLTLLVACRPVVAPAAVVVTFDLINGATGFAATIYAQEVTRGETATALYAAHSAPITMTLAAPGVYVFYARLVEAPDDYHYGASTCEDGAITCDKRILRAITVRPGGVYTVTIADRSPDLPLRDMPVTAPWRRQP